MKMSLRTPQPTVKNTKPLVSYYAMNKNSTAFTKRTFSSKTFFHPLTKSHGIPKLPVINHLITAAKQQSLPDVNHTVFVGVQHMLESTISLFDGLLQLGVKPENMYFSGKSYSSATHVEQQIRKMGIYVMPKSVHDKPGYYQEHCKENMAKLWQYCLTQMAGKPIDRLIILDEGGRCLETMPKFLQLKYSIAGIEQTTAGLFDHFLAPFPLIEVASSIAKRKLESPLIADVVVEKVKQKLCHLNLPKETVYGVIGNGAIGSSITQYLLSIGCSVIVHDKNPQAFAGISNKNMYRVDSLETLIATAQCIFGCTGRDVTEGVDVLAIAKDNKILISCSSEDKEFRSLLKTITQKNIVKINPLADIVCVSHSGKEITLINGGHPINFDGSPVSVPSKDIQLTRGLLLGACLQAILVAKKPIDDGLTINQPVRQALDPYLQRYVVNVWKKYQPANRYPQALLTHFTDIEWISQHSGGKYIEIPWFTDCFSTESLSNKTAIPSLSFHR